MQLKAGQLFTLTTKDIEGDNTQVSISYPSLIYDVDPGVKILIDDGLIEMTVVEVTSTDIICKVKITELYLTEKELIFRAFTYPCLISAKRPRRYIICHRA